MAKDRTLFTVEHWRKYGQCINDEWQLSSKNVCQKFSSLLKVMANEKTRMKDNDLEQSLNELRNKIPKNIWRKYANKVSKENGRKNNFLLSSKLDKQLDQLASLLHGQNLNKTELIEYALNVAILLKYKKVNLKSLLSGFEDEDEDELNWDG